MSAMNNSNLERFYAEINYDPETMSANVRGIDIFVEPADEVETSYLDNDYNAMTGDWLVHIVKTKRPLKELLFDFYHEVGHIFLKKGFIDLVKPSMWLDKVQCGVSSREYIMAEMACDGYAISELEYSGNIPKLLPMIKKQSIINKHKDATAKDIDRYLYEVNNDISVRRRYLQWLISENSVLGGADPKIMHSKDDINLSSLPNKKATKPPRHVVWNVVKEMAESVGIDTSIGSGLPKSRTLMMINLDKIGISYSSEAEFSELCDRLIRAITSENISMSYFNIDDHRFVEVTSEPSDWKKNFTKYYYYDKKLKTYLKYTQKTFSETNIETKDDIIDDIINGKADSSLDKTVESSVDKKETTTVVPEFDIVKTNVYKKVSVNTKKEAEKIRDTYKTIVKDFIIPWTAKFKDQYRVTDRNETRYVIERVLNYYITTKRYPSQEYITELQNDFRGINIDKTMMNSRTTGLLSYNEKVQIAKENHKKKNNETDEMYESRIRELVYTNRYNEKV